MPCIPIAAGGGGALILLNFQPRWEPFRPNSRLRPSLPPPRRQDACRTGGKVTRTGRPAPADTAPAPGQPVVDRERPSRRDVRHSMRVVSRRAESTPPAGPLRQQRTHPRGVSAPGHLPAWLRHPPPPDSTPRRRPRAPGSAAHPHRRARRPRRQVRRAFPRRPPARDSAVSDFPD